MKLSALSQFIEMVLRWVDRVLIVAAVVCLTVLVGVVFLAVVMRYVFNSPMLFSFDLSTLLFAWLVFVGLILADRDEAHMGLNLIPGLASVTLQNVLIAMRYLIVLALCVYLAWVGYQLCLRTGAQIPSLRISSRWLYSSMPLGFALLAISYLGRTVRHLAFWGR